MAPRATGPYMIHDVVGEVPEGEAPWAVNVKNAVTGELLLDHFSGQPDRISTERLVRFSYPKSLVHDYQAEAKSNMIASVESLQLSDKVLYLIPDSQNGDLTIGEVVYTSDNTIICNRWRMMGGVDWAARRWVEQPGSVDTLRRDQVFGRVHLNAKGVMTPETKENILLLGITD